MPCHAMPCYIMPYDIMHLICIGWNIIAMISCRAMSCHIMPCYTISCHVMPCDNMSCHVIVMALCYSGLPSELGPRRVAPWGGWCRRVQGPPSNWAESRRPCPGNYDAVFVLLNRLPNKQTTLRMFVSMFGLMCNIVVCLASLRYIYSASNQVLSWMHLSWGIYQMLTLCVIQLFLLDASKEELRAATLRSNGSSKARNPTAQTFWRCRGRGIVGSQGSQTLDQQHS